MEQTIIWANANELYRHVYVLPDLNELVNGDAWY